MDQPKLSSYRWVILVLVCLVCFLSNFMQYQVSALAVYIMPMFSIDEAGFSMLMLMPMLTAVFLSIPMGMLGDRIGPKKVVASCMVVAILGGFLRTFGSGFPAQMLSMFMLGAGISALNANLIKIFGTWFKNKAQLAMGFFYASSSLGVVAANIIAPMIGDVFSNYLASAIALTIVGALWLAALRDAPKGEALAISEGGSWAAFKVAAKSKNVWLIGLNYGLCLAAVTAFASLTPQVLVLQCGLDPVTAGTIASAAAIGSLLGELIGGGIGIKLGKWRPFIVVTVLIGALLMTYFWAGVVMPGKVPSVGLLIGIQVLAGAFGALKGPLVQAMPYALPEIRGKYAGSAGGIIGTIGLLCSYAIPVSVSAITVGNYTMNLALETLIFALSCIFILMVPELGPKSKIAAEIAAREAAQSDSVE
ncbi:MFS transporter [Ellagibacter isourolithinifaciens]|uniref:MFS transporter n=1 Tax=Ellagibacter isourolithinifaciens TaxID=2137581 RepID=UPI003A9549DF